VLCGKGVVPASINNHHSITIHYHDKAVVETPTLPPLRQHHHGPPSETVHFTATTSKTTTMTIGESLDHIRLPFASQLSPFRRYFDGDTKETPCVAGSTGNLIEPEALKLDLNLGFRFMFSGTVISGSEH